jgi:hypothetical protein
MKDTHQFDNPYASFWHGFASLVFVIVFFSPLLIFAKINKESQTNSHASVPEHRSKHLFHFGQSEKIKIPAKKIEP